MPLVELRGSEAFANLDSNPYGRWPADGGGIGEGHYQLSSSREGDIPLDRSFFTVGSCFARVVEERLLARGLHLSSFDLEAFVAFEGRRLSARRRPNGVVNQFNVFSMLQQLQRSSGEVSADPAALLVELADGEWIDLHSNPIFETSSRNSVAAVRAALDALFARAFESEVLILTLGLTDVWFDHETGLYLNACPPRTLVQSAPSRYTYQRTSFLENLQALEEIRRLVGRCSSRDPRFVVTCSPVFGNATFAMDNIAVASCGAKSTLRAVANEWVAANPEVEYFPAFEIVQSSEWRYARDADRSHVSYECSRSVVDQFERMFLSIPAVSRTIDISTYEDYAEVLANLVRGNRQGILSQLECDLGDLWQEMNRWEQIISADDSLRGRHRADWFRLLRISDQPNPA